MILQRNLLTFLSDPMQILFQSAGTNMDLLKALKMYNNNNKNIST